MKTKQFLLILLAVLLPLTTFADVWQDPETKVNYEYTVGVKEASVQEGFFAAGSPKATGNITILSHFTVDGREYTVTSIGSEAFTDCAGITSIVIPTTVKAIGWQAFSGCTGLSSIIIPEGVVSIEKEAFTGCNALLSLTISSTVKEIGRYAFENCNKLASVKSYIQEPFTIDNSVFYNNFNIATLYVPAGTKSKYKATSAWNQFKRIEEIKDLEETNKKGDVNGDGAVDVADIASVISIMANVGADPVPARSDADVNGDGKVDVADIATVISIMAGKENEPQSPGYYLIPSDYLDGWDEGVVTSSGYYLAMKRDDDGQGYVCYMNDKENSTLGLAIYFDEGFNVTEVVSEKGALRIDESYIYYVDASGNAVSSDKIIEENSSRRNVMRATPVLSQIGEAMPGLNKLVTWIGRYNTARAFFAGDWEACLNGVGTDLAGTLVGGAIGGIPGAIIGLGIGECFNILNNSRKQLDDASVNMLLGSSQVGITNIKRTGIYSYDITISVSGLGTRPTGSHWYNKQVDVMTGVYVRENFPTVTHRYKTGQSELIPIDVDGTKTVSVSIDNPKGTYYVAPVLIPYSGSYLMTGCIRYGETAQLKGDMVSITNISKANCTHYNSANEYEFKASVDAEIISLKDVSSWGVVLSSLIPNYDVLKSLQAPLSSNSCTLEFNESLSDVYLIKSSNSFKLHFIPFAVGKAGDIVYGETKELEVKPSELSCPDENHPHMIDLGLPSGTLWACCNVGSGTPEGYGNYYAWGETSPKSVYNWDTYQYWHDNNGNGCVNSNEMVNIGSDIAGTGYDAATANWGAPWRMPSLAQIRELLKNTTSTWTTQNGVYGRKFTGSNGGSVFLPAAGLHRYDGLCYAGLNGGCWSSSPYESYSTFAYRLGFGSGGAHWDYGSSDRYCGRSVRPVR